MSFAGMEDGQTIVDELAGGRQAILEYSAVVFVCCQSAAHSCSCDEKLFVANRGLKELRQQRKAPATTTTDLIPSSSHSVRVGEPTGHTVQCHHDGAAVWLHCGCSCCLRR